MRVKGFVEKGEKVMASNYFGPANASAELVGILPKFGAALVAAVIASFVLILGVEIDPTIETLILALSPVIVGYWWPNPGNVDRAT